MRSYMVVCILAIAILRTAGYAIVADSGNEGFRSTALTKNADILVDCAPTQPPVLYVRPSPLVAAVTPAPDPRPCYYLGIVAPGEMDKGILGPIPIPTPRYAPQKPGSIEYCHPAPPMVFVQIPGARTTGETPAPRP